MRRSPPTLAWRDLRWRLEAGLERLERRLPLLAPALGLWLGAALPPAGAALPLGVAFAAAALAAPRLRAGRLWLPLLIGSLAAGAFLRRDEALRVRCPPAGAAPAPALAELLARDPEAGGREALTLELVALGSPPREPLRCRALLSTGRRPAPGAEGDEIFLPAVAWAPPQRLVNPGSGDGAAAFRARGIERVGSLPDGAGLIALSDERSLLGRAGRARRAFAAWAESRLPPGEARALTLAASAGPRGRLSPELSDRLRETDLAHLALPGALALALLLYVAQRLARLLWARSERLALALPAGRAADLACLPIPALWALAVGPEGSPLRAAALATAYLLARALGRVRPRGLHPWTLAAFAAIAVEPRWARDPRLLELALLLAGLFLLGPPLAKRLGGPPGSPAARRLLGGAAAYALAGWLAALPLAFARGHRLALLSPLAGILGLLPAALLDLASPLARLLFLAAPPLAGAPLRLAHAAAAALVWLAARLARPLVPLPEPSPWLWPVLGAALLSLGIALRRPGRRAALAAALLAALFLAGLGLERLGRGGRLRLTFLSVGQGDGAVLELPDGTAIVLDAGGSPTGSFDPGREIVAPYLWSRGFASLRAAALSHPHPDHANGLPYLLASFGVGELWTTGQPCAIAACAELDRLAEERAVPRRRFGLGRESFDLGGVRFEALHPIGPAGYSPELGENDNSLVLRLSYGGFSALLPGDIEAPAEALLLASGADLSATLLKAPHHGSDTSSTEPFVAGVAPRAVVFSAGPKNRFGFPKAEVVRRWEAAGARTFRTDLDGAVTVETDGRSWTIRTAEGTISRTEGLGVTKLWPP